IAPNILETASGASAITHAAVIKAKDVKAGFSQSPSHEHKLSVASCPVLWSPDHHQYSIRTHGALGRMQYSEESVAAALKGDGPLGGALHESLLPASGPSSLPLPCGCPC